MLYQDETVSIYFLKIGYLDYTILFYFLKRYHLDCAVLFYFLIRFHLDYNTETCFVNKVTKSTFTSWLNVNCLKIVFAIYVLTCVFFYVCKVPFHLDNQSVSRTVWVKTRDMAASFPDCPNATCFVLFSQTERRKGKIIIPIFLSSWSVTWEWRGQR